MKKKEKNVYCVLLAGGVGKRLGADIPKQYITVNGKLIIQYAFDTIIKSEKIDGIVIVIDDAWEDFISQHINIKDKKFLGFARGGTSRQESILNGMKYLKNMIKSEKDVVLIHDAARPNITESLIERCVEFVDCDGVMPALESFSAMYYSEDGLTISSLLRRENVFTGQAPEAFLFNKYYQCFCNMTSLQLAEIKGSSEIAFKSGLKVKLVKGDENNYKITTSNDLKLFKKEKEEEANEGI